MTPIRTTRASWAGSTGSSSKNFYNMNMTVAFKDTSNERKLTKLPSKNADPNTNLLGHAEDQSHADEDAEGANEDGNVDDGVAGHAIAPPAHRKKEEYAASLSLDGIQTLSRFDELAGPDGNNAVAEAYYEGDFEGFHMPRRPSASDVTNSDVDMSDAEFDVADDDDDYGAVDQVGELSDDDVNIEASEAAHLASNVNDWSEQDVEKNEIKGENHVDWEDHRTYDFEFPYPYSEPFSEMLDPNQPFNAGMVPPHAPDMVAQISSPVHSSVMDCDPHLGPNLFPKDHADASSGSSSTSTNSDAGEARPTSPIEASFAREDDTEPEDLSEEIQRRALISQSRKKRKSLRKKRRSSDLDRPTSPQASKIKKFATSPKRVQVLPKMTASGRVVCLSIPRNTRVRWLVGRIPVDPAQHANSPEVTRSLRSRMFQQAYCPAPRELDVLRNFFLPSESTYRYYTQRPLRLLDAPSAAGSQGAHNQVPSLVQQSSSSFDFSDFIDDDGTPGLTLYEDCFDDLLDIGDTEDDDFIESPSTQGFGSRRVSELAEDASDDLAFGQGSGYCGGVGSDIDMESPCPKRRRTLESGDEVHRLESANQITV